MGIKMACAVRGMDHRDQAALEANVDTLLRSAPIQNVISKAAAIVMELGGKEGSLEHRLFCKMASCEHAFSDETVEAYLTPALYAFAEYGQKSREAAMTKQAGLWGWLAGLGLGSLSAAQKGVLLAALGVGGAGGTLGWIANRDSSEDSVDVEALEAQAEHYRDIASDIQKSMNLKDNKSVRDAVEAAGDAAYVL